MKQNVSETESNWRFRKTVKNMSTKQVSVSGATFEAWPFSSVLFRNVATFIESHCVFLCYFLLSSLLEGCYHYLVFMDPVNGYSKSKLLLKEQVSLKSKITFGYVCLFWFLYPSFLLLSIFSPPVQLKRLNPLHWAYPRLS